MAASLVVAGLAVADGIDPTAVFADASDATPDTVATVATVLNAANAAKVVQARRFGVWLGVNMGEQRVFGHGTQHVNPRKAKKTEMTKSSVTRGHPDLH